MVTIDSTYLPLLLHYYDKPLQDTEGNLIPDLAERIELLIKTLEDNDEAAVIPIPALTEFLVLARQDGQRYRDIINKNPLFKKADFNEVAGVDLAAMIRTDLDKMS